MAIFDMGSETYDSWYETKLGAFVDEVETELIMGKFKLRPGMWVLDSGCGTGNFSIKLLKLGCRVTGIDISEGMLEKARNKALKLKRDSMPTTDKAVKSENNSLRKNIICTDCEQALEFKYMDVYSLSYPDNYFDAAISIAQFEFLEDRLKAVEELLRVIKPGGQLIVGTINRDSAWGRLYLSEEFRKNSIFRYAKLMTIEELSAIRKQNLVDTGMSLFITPDAGESEITMEREKELSVNGSGGFICAVWVK